LDSNSESNHFKLSTQTHAINTSAIKRKIHSILCKIGRHYSPNINSHFKLSLKINPHWQHIIWQSTMRRKLHSLRFSEIQPLSIYSVHWHPINIQKDHKSSNSNSKIQNQPLSIVISCHFNFYIVSSVANFHILSSNRQQLARATNTHYGRHRSNVLHHRNILHLIYGHHDMNHNARQNKSDSK